MKKKKKKKKIPWFLLIKSLLLNQSLFWGRHTCFEEEEVEQEIALSASTMVLQFPLEKEPNYVTDCLVCDEELDDPKDNSVGHVVPKELEKTRPTENPKAELKTLPTHLKYVFLEDNETKPVIISNSLQKE